MPILIYIYCALITFSALYGIHILKPRPAYLAGVALFVSFCWLICIDYYAADLPIFRSQVTLAIYFLCAALWQIIEMKSLQAQLNSQKNSNSARLEALQQEFNGQSFGRLTYILMAIVAIFYIPIIYMGVDIFINIPS
ncbi:MAG: hypothetical protein HRU29_06775 [Rhizobiales bacterium]|nr:hypothetical protein [Hyphomicrobiales bacterium]NRB14089.1 hypothetical protein [Hyphomicrobiales bacterium]